MDLFKKWGISVSTRDEEVRHVYRLYVQKMHPDRVGNTKENQDAFCRLQEEYSLLKTQPKRQAYWNELQAMKAETARAQNFSDKKSSDSDLVSDSPPKTKIITGGTVVPPSNLNLSVPIPLILASTGGRIQVIVPYSRPCACGRNRSCRICKGTGQVWQEKKVRVFFGSGTENGTVVVLKGEGHQGTFENGDLFVTLVWTETFGWTWNKEFSRLEKRFVVPPFFAKSRALITKMPNGTIKKIAFKDARKSSSNEKIYFWVPTQDGFKKGFVIVKPTWMGFSGFFTQLGLRAKMTFRKNQD